MKIIDEEIQQEIDEVDGGSIPDDDDYNDEEEDEIIVVSEKVCKVKKNILTRTLLELLT